MVRRTEEAQRSGALRSMTIEHAFIREAGVRFLVNRLVGRPYKEQARQEQAAAQAQGVAVDPFLPYDPDLWVADLSPTHVCLLNKFNVIDHHLLVVTRAFEDQTAPLTLADFQALWQCMSEIRGLGFYNAGEVAGASQRHKHLQLAPYPLAPGVVEPPILPFIQQAEFAAGIGRSPRLPFVHAISRLEPGLERQPDRAAEVSYDAYLRLLVDVGLRAPNQKPIATLPPYNLLLTRSWMLLVPRRRETFASISVNALGFAGSFFVRNEEQWKTLQQVGPLAVLHGVGLAVAGPD